MTDALHLTVGTTTVDRVAELDSWPTPVTDMFPAVTPELYAGDTLDMSIATWVVRTPERTILVDAGNGNHKHRPVLVAHDGFDTDYLDRLRRVVAPEEIDVVVCSHLHPDHCGGLTTLVDGQWRPTFPNARHLLSRVEFEWMQALHASGPTDGPPADLARTWDDSVAPVIDAGLVDLVDVPVLLADGVTAIPAPGHTPGHLVVQIVHGDELALITGDVLHDSFQLADLSLAQSGDFDPGTAHVTRADLVARLADTGGLLLPAHFAPGRIDRSPDGFRYAPLAG